MKEHRTWEDGVTLILGILIGLSPWLCRETGSSAAVASAALSGLAILVIAQLEMVSVKRWEEALLFACGVWVVISPFVLGHAAAGQLRFWIWALGGFVMLISAFEIWQDWRKSDRDLANLR